MAQYWSGVARPFTNTRTGLVLVHAQWRPRRLSERMDEFKCVSRRISAWMVDCNTGPGPSAALVLQELRHGWQLRPLTLAMGICPWSFAKGRRLTGKVRRSNFPSSSPFLGQVSPQERDPPCPTLSKIVFVWLMHVQVARCTFADPERAA